MEAAPRSCQPDPTAARLLGGTGTADTRTPAPRTPAALSVTEKAVLPGGCPPCGLCPGPAPGSLPTLSHPRAILKLGKYYTGVGAASLAEVSFASDLRIVTGISGNEIGTRVRLCQERPLERHGAGASGLSFDLGGQGWGTAGVFWRPRGSWLQALPPCGTFHGQGSTRHV